VFDLRRRSSAVVASSRTRLVRTARSAINAPRRRCASWSTEAQQAGSPPFLPNPWTVRLRVP